MNTKQFESIQDPIARAEAMRAQAISQMVIDAVEGLRDLFKDAKAKLAAHLQYRRTINALSAMTDRELDDIGIGRSDIEAVARGFDPRPAKPEISMGDALAQRLVLARAFDRGQEVRKPAVQQAQDHHTAAAA